MTRTAQLLLQRGFYTAEFLPICLQVDNAVLEAAHLLLRPLCLRRLKEEVETTLPPRVRN